MKYLLDTCTVIFLLRGRTDVADAIDRVGMENCAISEITKAELLVEYYKAVLKGRTPDSKFFDFLDTIAIIPISQAIDTYSRELARMQCEGDTIDDFDLLIASTAVAHGLVLVTDNTSHLSRVHGVVCENWITREPLRCPTDS